MQRKVRSGPPTPGQYRHYPSSFVSDYYCWFLHMGYPTLDLRIAQGNQPIIYQMFNAPIIPSMTQWNDVLTFPKGFPISYEIFRKQVLSIDPMRQQYHDDQNQVTDEIAEEKEAIDRKAQDLAEQATKAVLKNDGIKERIAKNGMQEVDLPQIGKNIPKTILRDL